MDRFVTDTLASAAALSFASAATLGALARAEGSGALQPINATSHWLQGRSAGRVREADTAHTLLGAGTHFVASLMWAGVFQALRRIPRGRSAAIDAVGVSAVAALVDYGLVPKRLTPGWELAVSPAAIAAAYVAMAGALLATAPHARRQRARRAER